MKNLLENKFVRFGLLGLGGIILVAVVALWLLSNLFIGATGLNSGGIVSPKVVGTESFDANYADDFGAARSMNPQEIGFSAPSPTTPSGVTNLEAYETTNYNVSARTNEDDFVSLCDTLIELKTDDRFDFRNLNENINRCSASFFAAETDVAAALSRFEQFDDVVLDRNTTSVTRQREQLASRTDILRQQLASVERTLAGAETQFDAIIQVARVSNDASELADAIDSKLRMVDSLTQRKINLTSQINNALRQAQDLNERTGVVEFQVNISRSIPVQVNQSSRQWELAWERFSNRLTSTAIGLTALLGTFLLYTLQTVIYLLIIIVIVRLLWRFVKLVWKKL